MSVHENRDIKEIKVLIGQVHLTRPPHVLQSVLGSCIGVTIYDHETHLSGMAHVLLPHSGGKPRGALPGKYGDHAIGCLIEGLVTHGANRGRLRAKIAGGARMFERDLDYQRDIGSSNIASVEEALHAAGVTILARHLGGNLGRRIQFEPESFRLIVDDFSKNRQIL